MAQTSPHDMVFLAVLAPARSQEEFDESALRHIDREFRKSPALEKVQQQDGEYMPWKIPDDDRFLPIVLSAGDQAVADAARRSS